MSSVHTPVKIAIYGACGRMGKEIARAAAEQQDMEIVGAIERPDHPLVGSPYGAVVGDETCTVKVVDSLADLALQDTVIINFALADALIPFVKELGGVQTRLVLGTTGLTAEMQAAVRDLSQQVPMVVSPNMGTGVNVLFYLAQKAASLLGREYDIEIVEAHHRHKKDAPSGTAERLGQAVARGRGISYNDSVTHGRSGTSPQRPPEEIGMHAVRAGDIVGDHMVLLAGPGERIELRHMAHSRAIFAHGALRAARWVASRSAGLYTMQDVLGLGASS